MLNFHLFGNKQRAYFHVRRAVAGALGAKFAAPGRPCVSVCGDGAFFMHANVLGTAVEYNLPVVWVEHDPGALRPMSESGQKRKGSQRAYSVRITPKSGHR
jgi:thiamine pyrophosphate-dependent acetolactate synthase large subunit-like protein